MIVVVATTREQAGKIFDPAKLMVERTPALRDYFGLRTWANSISCAANGGKILPLFSAPDSNDGWNPHAGFLDELHAHKTRAMFDVIESASGSRDNFMLWIITTAGFDSTGICYEQRKITAQILEGTLEMDHWFGCVFTIDERDDPFDPSVWRKANPMLGITPRLAKFEEAVDKAKASPASLYNFLTKRLNVWTSAKGALFNMLDYHKSDGAERFTLESVAGLPCYGGLDLARKLDLAAAVFVFAEYGEKPKYHFVGRYYLPEDTIADHVLKRNVRYQQWVDAGVITATPGATIDLGWIERDVREFLDKYDVRAIGFDPWRADAIVDNLLESGAPMVEMRQGGRTFERPISVMEAAIADERIRANEDPVLSWCFSNVVPALDRNENRSVDRAHSTEKIDGAVAALMAMNGHALKLNVTRRTVGGMLAI